MNTLDLEPMQVMAMQNQRVRRSFPCSSTRAFLIVGGIKPLLKHCWTLIVHQILVFKGYSDMLKADVLALTESPSQPWSSIQVSSLSPICKNSYFSFCPYLLRKVSPWLLPVSLCLLHWSMKLFIHFFLCINAEQWWCFSLTISTCTLSLTNLLAIMLFFSKELIMHHVNTSISSQYSAFRQHWKFQSCSSLSRVKKNKYLNPTHNVPMLLISYLKFLSFLKWLACCTEILLLSAFNFLGGEPVMLLLSRTGYNIPPEHKGIITLAVLFSTPLHLAMLPFLVIICFRCDRHLSSYYLSVMVVCWLSLGSRFLLPIPCWNALYLKGRSSDHHCMWTGRMLSGWSRNEFCEVNVFTLTLYFSCGWDMTRAEKCVW